MSGERSRVVGEEGGEVALAGAAGVGQACVFCSHFDGGGRERRVGIVGLGHDVFVRVWWLFEG